MTTALVLFAVAFSSAAISTFATFADNRSLLVLSVVLLSAAGLRRGFWANLLLALLYPTLWALGVWYLAVFVDSKYAWGFLAVVIWGGLQVAFFALVVALYKLIQRLRR